MKGPAGGAGKGGAPPRPEFGSQIVMLVAFMVALLVLFDNNLRQSLGRIVGLAFMPLIGFSGQYPVMTLVCAGLIMTLFSVTVRHFFIDWVAMARNQRIMSAFQKEMREARTSNNTFKLKKLTEIQPKMTAQSLKSTQSQLKLMPITMIVIIPIFAWISNFVYQDLSSTIFSVPWEFNADMKNSNVLPNWILLYSLVTIPFGQVLQRTLKLFSFTKKLRQLEHGVEDSPVERI
ncbi:MAG TPA: EMC3/TMCO1 family protein [Thermoplasmata archaeon]|nr:EMC3/TMCO1 family protein [Thermoplasmata archaeon]